LAKRIARRQAAAALAGLPLLWPLVARGQAAGPPARIGFLYPGVARVTPTRIAALREGMAAVNYANAERVEVVVRASEGDPAKLPSLAAGLVDSKVDVILAISPSAVAAAKAATTTLPIVANDLESDPIQSGFVTSLARPGGNITGVFSDFPDFGMKWLELLKEALPTLLHVVVFWDPATGPTQLAAVKAASELLKVAISVVEVPAIAELKGAFAKADELHPEAVVILSSPIFGTNPKLIADLALAHRIPIATLFSEIARAGGLLSYGPNLLGTFVQTGTMVGKILQGAKPADLPVERPTKFELVINAGTAKALGLALPTAVLLRADDVIE
jgi:putative ABC transport system substrate-binding protein